MASAPPAPPSPLSPPSPPPTRATDGGGQDIKTASPSVASTNDAPTIDPKAATPDSNPSSQPTTLESLLVKMSQPTTLESLFVKMKAATPIYKECLERLKTQAKMSAEEIFSSLFLLTIGALAVATSARETDPKNPLCMHHVNPSQTSTVDIDPKLCGWTPHGNERVKGTCRICKQLFSFTRTVAMGYEGSSYFIRDN